MQIVPRDAAEAFRRPPPHRHDEPILPDPLLALDEALFRCDVDIGDIDPVRRLEPEPSPGTIIETADRRRPAKRFALGQKRDR